MPIFITSLATLAYASLTAQVNDGPANNVPFTQIHIKDRFWTPRQEVNQRSSVWHCLEELEKTGDLQNFRIVAKGGHTGHSGFVFQDSDVYKVLEGAADSLATNRDAKLDQKLDEIIALIASAQMADGYVDTFYQITAPDERFTNLRDNHELYCAGHLIEAAVAHFQATGKKNLLAIATKYADLLNKKFGPDSGKIAYCGHPELELALVKLSHVTNEPRYFALAQKLVMTRGSKFFATEHDTPLADYDGTYWLDDVPITQHKEIKGHAVRAAYLMSGTTDVARENGDPALAKMLDRVWRNVTQKRIFLTGGIGPSGSNEGFTVDYDLPNESAYQETCASIAMAMWGYRMGMLHTDAKYFDAVENSLYNATLAGVALDGKHFFYVNPLASRGNHHRQEWFDCACCPPNALRTIAAVGGYAYGQRGDRVYVNLYLPGSVDLKVGNQNVKLSVAGDYPWNGHLTLKPEVKESTHLDLRLRIPGWVSGAKLTVNRAAVSGAKVENGYFVVDRTWNAGDSVEVDFPMPVDRVAANPQVKDDQLHLAVRRGPLVYCAEAVDQSSPVSELVLPADASLKPSWKGDLLGGVEVLEGSAERVSPTEWDHTLYQSISKPQPTAVKLIPYCDWDNRKAGQMAIWFPTTPPPDPVGGAEVHAKIDSSFFSGNSQTEGIHDGVEPRSSGEQPQKLFHWWPHKGTQEWVSYTWTKPISVKGVRVYWFDDTGRGECRLPDSWSLETLQGDKWVPVDATVFPVQGSQWNEVSFAPIQTKALRLVVKLKQGWAAGVRQWKVIEADE